MQYRRLWIWYHKKRNNQINNPAPTHFKIWNLIYLAKVKPRSLEYAKTSNLTCVKGNINRYIDIGFFKLYIFAKKTIINKSNLTRKKNKTKNKEKRKKMSHICMQQSYIYIYLETHASIYNWSPFLQYSLELAIRGDDI